MHQRIRSEIELIAPFDAVEASHLAEAMAWIASGAPLFRIAKPAQPPRHLVSYFAVVDEEGLLLVDHKNAQRWLPPGGHVEPGEHPRETVVRELLEELGFRAHHEIGAPLMITSTATVGLTAGHTDVSLWYVIRADRQQGLQYDKDEFNSVQWFDFSDIPYDRTDPHLHRFVQKLRSGLSLTSAS